MIDLGQVHAPAHTEAREPLVLSRTPVPCLAFGCVLSIALGLATVAAAAGPPIFNGVASVTDGAGGVIFAWADARSSYGVPTSQDMFAGRIGSDGVPVWPANGVPVCTSPGEQRPPSVVSDAQGGAFILWTDSRPGGTTDIYAQHIDANGLLQWAPGGAPVCVATGNQQNPAMIPDGAGGIIVAWEDWRSGVDVYAQRIDANGMTMWVTNGTRICTASGSQYTPALVSDGAGGAIIAWTDFRSSGGLYAQRVNPMGSPQWVDNGVPVIAVTGSENIRAILEDGSGGAFVTCTDLGNASIRVQRVNASGVAQWAAGGISPCSVAYSASSIGVTPDALGGLILVWGDPTRGGVYGQDVALDGSLGWGPEGQLVPGVQGNALRIQADGAGGAFIGSQLDVDFLNAFANAGVQHVNASGVSLWGPGGIALPITDAYHDVPAPIADGAGGVIFMWSDHGRSCGMHPPCSATGSINEYARRFDGNGDLVWASIALSSTAPVGVEPESPAELALMVDGASPSVGGAKLRFALPSRANVRLALYDVAGRLVARLVDGEMPAGEHTVTWNADASRLSGGAGIFFARLQVGRERIVSRIVVLE